MKPFDFGSVGILQIGDARYGFRPTELYREYGSAPILKGEFLPDVFAASNLAQGKRVGKCATLEIVNVIFNDPATVVIWNDGTKTVVKCQPGDIYSKETGLALCIAKKYLGNKGNFNEVFKKWIPEETEPVEEVEISVEEMRKALSEYCHAKDYCNECPLCMPVCRCGCGTHFHSKRGDRYDMTDDEIRAAYEIVFNRK